MNLIPFRFFSFFYRNFLPGMVYHTDILISYSSSFCPNMLRVSQIDVYSQIVPHFEVISHRQVRLSNQITSHRQIFFRCRFHFTTLKGLIKFTNFLLYKITKLQFSQFPYRFSFRKALTHFCVCFSEFLRQSTNRTKLNSYSQNVLVYHHTAAKTKRNQI